MTDTRMRKPRLLATAASALAIGVFAPAPAFAQDDPAAAETPESSEVILVTAQKREQALSDVSLAVSAVDGDRLVESNTFGIEALQNLVPSISFGNDFNFAKLFIRGVGLSSSLPGVDPSVALHVDGMVVSLAQAQLGSMFDLERVEVLRGPQGTLYGRNATGGAVNLITAKPTDQIEGYVRMTVGGPDLQFLGEAAVSGPLSDKVRGRLARRRARDQVHGAHLVVGHRHEGRRELGRARRLDLLQHRHTRR